MLAFVAGSSHQTFSDKMRRKREANRARGKARDEVHTRAETCRRQRHGCSASVARAQKNGREPQNDSQPSTGLAGLGAPG